VAVFGVLLALPASTPAQEKKAAPEEEPKAEDLLVPSVAGYNVYACLRRPEGDGPYPAVIVVHGGLGEASRRALRSNLLGVGTPVMDEMFKAGYVVVMTDFRRHDFGGKEIDDVVAVFNYVAGLPYVDKGRIGIYGASHGGYIALMASTLVKPAAVVACAPVVDLVEEFRNVPAPPETPPAKPSARLEFARELVERFGGPPQNVPHKYEELSILTYAGKISCPVLVIQGTSDQLLAGSKLLKEEMDRQGKSCELALYPDQPHGFYWGLVRAGGVTQATKDALTKALSFLDQHLRK
jgi:dipeptidyl aminopeptidase/acylaminoacyl peptidase